MLSRALSLATVMLLIGCFAAKPAQAQAQNLEAGKSPSQIFAGTCNACHKSPRGLLKTVPAGSLPGFLRQHYTTSGDMASLLSAFLISNGATDTRYGGGQPKQGKDAKPEPGIAVAPDHIDRFGRRQRPTAPAQEGARPEAEPREAARPDADGISPQGGRNAKRLARPSDAPDAAKPGVEGQAEHGPDGRNSAKQKLGKRSKPGSEEPPKVDAAKPDTAKPDAAREETVKGEPATDDKPKGEAPKNETAKDEGKTEGAKPAGEPKSESAKSESAKSEPAKSEPVKSEPAKSEPVRSEPVKSESSRIEAPKDPGSGSAPVLRADPVPPVTPAPPASPSVSAAVSGGAPEPAPGPSAAPAPSVPPPAVTASAPPPVSPAGPPVPPISK
jgi:hypothetical protein